jgi:hypothetical protein
MIFWTTRRRRVEHQGYVINIHTTYLFGILPLRTVWEIYTAQRRAVGGGKAVGEENALHDALLSLGPLGPDGQPIIDEQEIEARPRKTLFGKEV